MCEIDMKILFHDYLGVGDNILSKYHHVIEGHVVVVHLQYLR